MNKNIALAGKIVIDGEAAPSGGSAAPAAAAPSGGAAAKSHETEKSSRVVGKPLTFADMAIIFGKKTVPSGESAAPAAASKCKNQKIAAVDGKATASSSSGDSAASKTGPNTEEIGNSLAGMTVSEKAEAEGAKKPAEKTAADDTTGQDGDMEHSKADTAIYVTTDTRQYTFSEVLKVYEQLQWYRDLPKDFVGTQWPRIGRRYHHGDGFSDSSDSDEDDFSDLVRARILSHHVNEEFEKEILERQLPKKLPTISPSPVDAKNYTIDNIYFVKKGTHTQQAQRVLKILDDFKVEFDEASFKYLKALPSANSGSYRVQISVHLNCPDDELRARVCNHAWGTYGKDASKYNFLCADATKKEFLVHLLEQKLVLKMSQKDPNSDFMVINQTFVRRNEDGIKEYVGWNDVKKYFKQEIDEIFTEMNGKPGEKKKFKPLL